MSDSPHILPGFVLPPAVPVEQAIDQAEAARGVFSGARLRVQEPRLYAAILALSARQMSAREIADVLQVSANTVAAVIRAEPVAIEATKQRLSRTFAEVAQLATEAARAKLLQPGGSGASLKDLALVAAITTDKALLTGDQPTQIIETRQAVPEADELARMLQAAPAIIDADAIETGYEGRGGRQRGGPIEAPRLEAQAGDPPAGGEVAP